MHEMSQYDGDRGNHQFHGARSSEPDYQKKTVTSIGWNMSLQMAEFFWQDQRRWKHTSSPIMEGSRRLTLHYRIEFHVVGGRFLVARRKQNFEALAWSINSFLLMSLSFLAG